jgi:hypothetical protein
MNMFESLLTQPQQSQVQPELLEMLGRQASKLFKQGTPLNNAITQVIADHPELGNEHIKRVVEFANNVTFQELFQSSSDKNVHFEVADPGVVLRDVKDGGSPAHDGKTLNGGLGDYKSMPSNASNPELEQALYNQFNTEGSIEQGQSKLASVEANQGHANAFDDLHDTYIRLTATREKLAEAHEGFDLALQGAREDLYQAVKYEVVDADGSGLGGVLGALEKIASKEVIASVLSPMVERLAGESVSAKTLSLSLEKRAGRFVNLNHHVIQAWTGMVKAAEEIVRSQEALSEVDGHIHKVSSAITNAVKGAVKAKSPIPNGIRQRFPRV